VHVHKGVRGDLSTRKAVCAQLEIAGDNPKAPSGGGNSNTSDESVAGVGLNRALHCRNHCSYKCANGQNSLHIACI